jgi:hypothetical protein
MMFQPKSNGTNARKICLHISDSEKPADKFRFTKEIASSIDVVKFINRLEGESLSQFNLLVENIQSANGHSHLEPYEVIIDEFMRQIQKRQSIIDSQWQIFDLLPMNVLKEIFPTTYKKIFKKDRDPTSWLLSSHQINVAILGYLDHSIDEWNSNENDYNQREGALILEAKIRKLFQSRNSTKEQATQAKTETNNKCYSLEMFSTPDPAQSEEINSIR